MTRHEHEHPDFIDDVEPTTLEDLHEKLIEVSIQSENTNAILAHVRNLLLLIAAILAFGLLG